MAVDLGRDLPNLKITVGNDSTGETREPGEICETDPCLAEENQDANEQLDVQIVRKLLTPSEGFRVYENKGGAFVTGLDLSSEVVTKKLADRASRFGLTDHPKTPVTQTEIDALYKSLDINPEDGKTKNVRLDALHMRGVEEMNTNEIIDYFKEFGPALVEWINDCSCNVVWLDSTGAARALLGLSRVFVLKKKAHTTIDSNMETDEITTKNVAGPLSTSQEKESEEVIFMSDLSSDDDDDEDKDKDRDKDSRFKRQNDGDTKNADSVIPMDVSCTEEGQPKETPKEGDNAPVDMPIPPGHWRLGVPHEKAKAILLRFASKDDRKLPGAEKRSDYYRKYGNPNYGGMTGLISKTRKRKINATKQRQVIEQLSTKTNASSTVVEPKLKRAKQMRMRMVADDEEEKVRARNARRLRDIEEPDRPRNVHDRLGGAFINTQRRSPYDYDRPDSENEYDYEREHEYEYEREREYEYEREREHDEPRMNLLRSVVSQPQAEAKFSRFNIWNRLAASMAEESESVETSYRPVSPNRQRRKDLRSRLGAPIAHRSSFTGQEQGDLRSKLTRKRDNEGKVRSPMLLDSEDVES